MVNWSDPNVMSLCSSVSAQVNFVCLGVYIWEYAQSSEVELALIRRRMPPRWPLLPYISGRIFLLMAIFMICWLGTASSPNVDCHSAFLIFAFVANGAIGCSSLNLMLRPFIIWRGWRCIRIFLVLATVGHWVFLLRVMFEFNIMHVDGSCGFMIIDHTQMTSLFIYTMCYDILALALTIIGLRNTRSSNVIWRTLRIQGISYVVVTCLANVVPAILSSLNLNTVMNVAFAIPSSLISTIASSRIVLSFLDLQPSGSAEPEEISSRDVPLTTMLTLPTSSIAGQSSGWGTDL
ncbi:hypothetical protein K503DRAFT_774022 [Rhizopogon vinicolor AM-OR11-026]|uniref:Uncharacterized protein n=1 Tax=Rhizopogon vinicolor AM-OR11-026 TaxID=1314800 RepID=A0A1B7MQQ3_9AGAM|nr:hypothetical protein K503DRAFT_774022 [Rhizopogon vinicolor AM-OR11-026]